MLASCDCCGGLTVSDAKDHYAVLGLDRDASRESIKLAYRRLARENHPDLVHSLGAEVANQAAVLMRDINEAYRVLSNAQLRREYDAGETGSPLPAAGPVVEVAAAEPTAAAAPSRGRARPPRDALASVVTVFAKQFHKDLPARAKAFQWSDVSAEGFDWMTVASFWTARYAVGLRGVATADVDAATKFTNYCNLAFAQNKHALKQTFFLFFLAFQKMNDGASVAALLRRFIANENGQRTPGAACIVLTDVVRGKSLLCGVRLRDSRYEQLLVSLGLARQD